MANTPNQGRNPWEQSRQTGVGGAASSVKETAQQAGSAVAEKAGEAWETARESAQQAASYVADTAGDAWEGVNDFMKRYPIATFLAGVGLGMLLCGALTGASLMGSGMIRGMERSGSGHPYGT